MRKPNSITVDGWTVAKFNQTDPASRRKWGPTWFKFRLASGRLSGESCPEALHSYVPTGVLKAAKARWPEAFATGDDEFAQARSLLTQAEQLTRQANAIIREQVKDRISQWTKAKNHLSLFSLACQMPDSTERFYVFQAAHKAKEAKQP